VSRLENGGGPATAELPICLVRTVCVPRLTPCVFQRFLRYDSRERPPPPLQAPLASPELIGDRGLWPHRRPPRAPSFRRLLSSRRQARGGAQWLEAPWERVAAGSGSLGAASSESAAGSGRLRGCGCCVLSRPRFRSSRCRAGCVFGGFGWFLVVRFVCVIRVPVCARVPRLCPVCVSRLPPVSLNGMFPTRRTWVF
jgi:hypothetical protein